MRSPFTQLEGMPLQSVAAADVHARVEIRGDLVKGLRDLDSFSHLHLITHLHYGAPGGLIQDQGRRLERLLVQAGSRLRGCLKPG